MLSLRSASFVVLAFVGCAPVAQPIPPTPSPPPPPAPSLEIPVDSEPGPEAPAVAASDPCGLGLRVDRVEKSSPTCTVDLPEPGEESTLECDGGHATLRYGNRAYVGTLTQGELALESQTSYDFTDGCHWVTHQQLTGNVDSEISIDYEEAPESGADCADACTARAFLIAVR